MRGEQVELVEKARVAQNEPLREFSVGETPWFAALNSPRFGQFWAESIGTCVSHLEGERLLGDGHG